MFYIQTQDGELPDHYKVYETKKGARAGALRFIKRHSQEGQINVLDSLHGTHFVFFRDPDQTGFTEEVVDEHSGEVIETRQH